MAIALPRLSRSAQASDSTSLQAVDFLLLAYLGLVTVVAAVRVKDRSAFWWLLLAHALFVVLLFLLTRPGLSRVRRAIRELYPLFLLPGLYSELDILNPVSLPVYDRIVQQWELWLFGAQLSQEWWQTAPSRFLSSVLHAAYLSYYAIVSAPALYFAWRGNLEAVRRFVLVVMTTFVLCYLFFIFFPVAGPYYTFPHPPAWFTDNAPARLVYRALETGSSYGAAFPSSHVAAALAATLTAGRVSRQLGYILHLPTLLLTLGVVYCQMHYAVDAAAGLVVGALVSWALLRKP
ncbi:MAG TPA: phosphatase PAP2 family protein [Gemmatimonadales bacterium]|nr:phosphatase PAP2 family protein [Gemmatimonadales bacterium]